MLPLILGSAAPSFALDATEVMPVGQYQEIPDAAP
jgi:hypothetical protein